MPVKKDHSSGAIGPIWAGGVDAKKIISGEFTFSASYSTGGEDLGILGEFRKVDRVVIGSFPVTATVASAKYDQATGKVKAFVAAGTEVTANTDLHSVTVEFIAIGLP